MKTYDVLALNLIITVTIIALFVFGFALGRSAVVTDCEKLGVFRSDDKVFECRIKDLQKWPPTTFSF